MQNCLLKKENKSVSASDACYCRRGSAEARAACVLESEKKEEAKTDYHVKSKHIRFKKNCCQNG